ncbi:MAG: Multi-sensor hybrid histidine kinase [Candidatus Magnetoglobus multicellularis str. Araruama]|uniref:histidine kinase n=1 Tax=Candidatus Magnetoglobus multicellularis str. Araruama TaxID=890399 RepID=A0A1V1PG82_9BACT|nr:MAG: Multi-sensor hybrid histidine kinase [Candidatus Magnetoglobus multicellularis str. Araruama]
MTMNTNLTFNSVNLSKDLKDELLVQFQKADLKSVNIIASAPHQSSSTAPILEISPKDLLVLLKQFCQQKTELEKRVDLALRRATQIKKSSKDADTAKSHFFANINHEIRTPLNAIVGMTDLLMDTELNTEQLEYVESVSTATKSLHYFVNDLLDYSKLENEQFDLNLIDFDFRVAIEEVVDMHAARAFSKGLNFTCTIDHRIPPMLHGDPARLRQILSHITDNAIKFTDDGWVTIDVKYIREIDQFVAIRFEINDTGIGINQKEMETIIAPFVQGDGSTTRKYGGIGMGLTLSRRLIDLMEGTLDISSNDGNGTTITIHLTLEKKKNESDNICQCADIAGKHFLIVDNNETNRHVLREMLRWWACTFDEVSTGKQAINNLQAEDKTYDAVLFDMELPDMTGTELIQLCKENKSCQDIKTLMITSLGQRGEASKLKDMGLSGYLTRPVRHAVLHDALAELLDCSPKTHEDNDNLITKYSVQENKKRRTRILLVDDSIVNQQIASKIIEKLGFRVDVASNGQEAITALAQTPYDIVFMDVQMPVMDGIEATKHIRNKTFQTHNPDVPIIAMTAHTLPGIQKQFNEAGMNDTIIKPIHPDEILKCIKTYSCQLCTKKEIKTDTDENSTPEEQTDQKTIDIHTGSATSQNESEFIYDRESLLKRLDGDEELCYDILSDFLNDIPELSDTLKMAIDQKDYKTIAFIAFTIKEGAADISSDPIMNLCEQIELAAKATNLEKVKLFFNKLQTQIQRLKNSAQPQISVTDFCILVVEDEPSNQKLMERLLKKKNYSFQIVSSGHDAIMAMKSKRFDLVFMDVQLPGMDGMETTHRIRSEEPQIINPDVPIVAVSAHALTEDRSLFISANMNDFIEKPVQKAQLYKKLNFI